MFENDLIQSYLHLGHLPENNSICWNEIGAYPALDPFHTSMPLCLFSKLSGISLTKSLQSEWSELIDDTGGTYEGSGVAILSSANSSYSLSTTATDLLPLFAERSIPTPRQ